MKKLSTAMAIGILLVLTNSHAFSQDEIKMKVIEPYRLSITYFKTSNLIFPYPIVSADRGSKDVLVQQAKGVDNILQVKAGKEDFEESNLTVITADGHLYSYILCYTDNPSALNIQFTADKLKDTIALFPTGSTNEAQLHADAGRIAGKKRTIHGIKDKKQGMRLRLNGLFIRDNIMYCQIKLGNSSNINYDIDQFRFFISDQVRSKRTATQELEIKPLYVHQDTVTVKGQSEHTIVFALPKFTIPDNKQLIVQVMEKNGGRHLELKVKNRAIARAKALSDKR